MKSTIWHLAGVVQVKIQWFIEYRRKTRSPDLKHEIAYDVYVVQRHKSMLATGKPTDMYM